MIIPKYVACYNNLKICSDSHKGYAVNCTFEAKGTFYFLQGVASLVYL